MDDAILGLDIGTTSVKAVLFDLFGAELAAAERACRLRTPQPGWVEQDPEEVWQAVLHVLRAVMDGTGLGVPSHGRPLALALAAQSGSLLPARQDGTPISPIITWMDGRTEALVHRWLVEGAEAKVRDISGWHLHPGLCLPAIAWLRQHQPDLFATAGRYLSVNDFLVHRLTGRFCTNPSNGGGMQLLDVTSAEWSDELCALAGIGPGHLSPILPSGAVTGQITPEVSHLTGLPADTVVVNGGHDQGCTALGLGVTEPGRVLLGCGTAWVVTGVTDTPDVASLPPTLDLNFHPASDLSLRGALATKQSPTGPSGDCFAPLVMTGASARGRWTVSQSLGGLGASLEWLLRQCWPGTERAAAYANLDTELAQSTPSGNGLFFLPPTGGHSAPAGNRSGGLWGLRLDHTRADMARAVMEGAAYELRWALEPIRVGMPVERMWMIGGAASSSLWPSIVADVAGVPLSLPQPRHWPAVGAAILAGVGIGAFETLTAGQARFQMAVRQIEPDPGRMQIYGEHYPTYQRLVGQRAAVQAAA